MSDLIVKFDLDQQRRGLQPNTIQLRNRQLTLFERESGPLEATTTQQIQEWLDGRDISDKTRSCYLTTLSAFYKWAIKHDELIVNPIEKIDRPKVHNGMPNPIPEADLARAMKEAKPLMRCWLALEAYGGLRCQEVAFLEASDIRWDMGKVHVRFGKGGSQRYVTIHEEIAAALRAYDEEPRYNRATLLRAEGEGRLWPRCTPSSVSQRINRYLHGMGITHTAHKNRHRYGTQLHKASGGDLLVVQRALGHSSPSTSAIYAGIDDQAVQAAALAIPIAG